MGKAIDSDNFMQFQINRLLCFCLNEYIELCEVSQWSIDELYSVLSLAFISNDQMYFSFQVAEFAPSEVRPNQITFRWTLPPDEENGILLGFKIKYGIKVRIIIICIV